MIKEKTVLASASPRRKELMKYIAENVEVRPVDCDETLPENIAVENAAEYLSKIKSEAALKNATPSEITVCADTVVVADGIILGKPADKTQARRMMEMLSGKTHAVYTGVTVSYNNRSISFTEKTEVTFYELSSCEIEEYISCAEPYDKAGGYGIQGRAAVFIKSISGDYYNVVGLPVARLKRELEKVIELRTFM